MKPLRFEFKNLAYRLDVELKEYYCHYGNVWIQPPPILTVKNNLVSVLCWEIHETICKKFEQVSFMAITMGTSRYTISN